MLYLFYNAYTLQFLLYDCYTDKDDNQIYWSNLTFKNRCLELPKVIVNTKMNIYKIDEVSSTHDDGAGIF